MGKISRGPVSRLGQVIFFGVFCLSIAFPAIWVAVGQRPSNWDIPWAVIAFTLKQAVLSTLGAVLIGFPIGVGLVRGPEWLLRLLALSMVLPVFVVVSFWLVILRGTSLSYSEWAVIFAHIGLNAAWVAHSTARKLQEWHEEWSDQARVMGLSTWDEWLFIKFKWLRPLIQTLLLQVFVLCATSFTLVLYLGGGPPVETLETQIYRYLRYDGIAISPALGIAFIQCLMTLIPSLLLYKSRRDQQEPVQRPKSRPNEFSGSAVFLGLILIAPFFFGLSVPRQILLKSDFWISFFESFGLAVVGAGLTVFWAMGRPSLKLIAILSGLSPLVVSVLLWNSYGEWVDFFSGWTARAMTILIQSLLFLPWAERNLAPYLTRVSQRALEQARVLGLGPYRAWWVVEWPRLARPLLGTYALVFAFCMGETAVVHLFTNEEFQPLTVYLGRQLNQYQFREFQEGVTVLFIVVGIIYWMSQSTRQMKKELQ